MKKSGISGQTEHPDTLWHHFLLLKEFFELESMNSRLIRMKLLCALSAPLALAAVFSSTWNLSEKTSVVAPTNTFFAQFFSLHFFSPKVSAHIVVLCL